MKVYVVTVTEYDRFDDSETTTRVFSTEALAEAYADEFLEDDEISCEITECEVETSFIPANSEDED